MRFPVRPTGEARARRRARAARVARVVLACGLLLVAAACSERSAQEGLDELLAGADDKSLPQLESELREIIAEWPETRAAARAKRELEWVVDLQSAQTRGTWLEAADAVRKVAAAAERYRIDRGAYPRDLSDLVPRYLDEPVVDPWGGEVLYKGGGRRYTVVSFGADGLPGGSGPERDMVVETGRMRAGTAP